MIRIGKTLLVIGCLSLASAACASDDAATHAERIQKLLEDRIAFLNTVVAGIKQYAPNYQLNEMPDKSAVLYTARITLPGGIFRTIYVTDKPVTKRATVLDVDGNLNPSSTSFEANQAQSILDAMKQHGTKL